MGIRWFILQIKWNRFCQWSRFWPPYLMSYLLMEFSYSTYSTYQLQQSYTYLIAWDDITDQKYKKYYINTLALHVCDVCVFTSGLVPLLLSINGWTEVVQLLFLLKICCSSR
ncbi:hypothetical protein HanRHA438_Chr05g0213111 [Helianthus annuus]|uniref:Uncharacterized protein n=1 Tax=Helianthus annuus TaxID=4232 RepID=A0A251UPE9_HELAN|nr:hypothetical protein HanXRQr2_Chr05g0203251 [Helianthus annuus]KAJ0569504.1 hypothetical protein HanHA300_Chr05g0166941 [Helianthus annuus]KAJ0583814.1 hypothetical protein HanHA89_Chr05g0180981 [Helianthus annuus]KAJ0918048.1 hypothetical protein HanRHA438_Chr05g0213111 [Helianthus annuus]